MVKYNQQKQETVLGPHDMDPDRVKKLRSKFTRLEQLRKPLELIWDLSLIHI